MQIIKKLGRDIDNNGKVRYFALFKCEACGDIIRTRTDIGSRNKSCGKKSCQLKLKKEHPKWTDKRREKWLRNRHTYKKRKNKIITSIPNSKTRLYRVWAGIISRCENKNVPKYKYWGGRGIKVCDEWRKSFIDFKKWALHSGYSDDLQIDRINNDKGYYPENCRFTTTSENIRNRSITKMNWAKVDFIRDFYKNKEMKGKNKYLSDMFCVSTQTIWEILNNKSWRYK